MRTWISVLVLCAAVAVSAVRAQAVPDVRIARVWDAKSGTPVVISDLLEVTDLGGVAASPDGAFVAFISRTAREECDCHRQILHLLDRQKSIVNVVADLGEPFRLIDEDGATLGALMTAQPLWSRDSRQLAFIANRDGRATLMLWEPGGGKARALIGVRKEVFEFMWGRAPGELVYLTGGPDPEREERFAEARKSGFLYGPDFAGVPVGKFPSASRVPIRFRWNATDGSRSQGPRAELKVMQLGSGQSRSATAEERRTFEHTAVSSAYLSVQDRPVRTLLTPDERFHLTMDMGTPWDRTAVTVRDVLDPVAQDRSLDDHCSYRIVDAYWNELNGRFVLVCIKTSLLWGEGTGHFVSVDPRTGRGEPWFELMAPGIFDGRLGRPCDASRGEMVCVLEEPSNPPRLVAIAADGRQHTLFDPNFELRDRRFARVEQLEWTNELGADTWGFLVYPQNYKPGLRYPLVVVQYNASGFLRGGTGNEYPIFPFSESGLFVLNLRHPSPVRQDRELSYIELNAAQWKENRWKKSVQSSIDISIDYLIGRGLVDKERIAYTGLSGGANQIEFALANGRPMAAMISSTCCIGPENWPMAAANLLYSDFLKIVDWGNPAVDADAAAKWAAMSASMNVDKIHAAILANVAESEMVAPNALWVKMRASHRPMEVHIYPGAHHMKGSPAQRASIYRRNVDWLRFWLQGYEDPAQEKEEQYRRWRDMREEWKAHGPSGADSGGS